MKVFFSSFAVKILSFYLVTLFFFSFLFFLSISLFFNHF